MFHLHMSYSLLTPLTDRYYLLKKAYKKARESVLVTRPTYQRLSHCPSQLNEQRRSPRRNMLQYITVHTTMTNTYPTSGIYRCFALDCDSEFARFLIRQEQSASSAFPYVMLSLAMHPPPSVVDFCQRTTANIHIILLIVYILLLFLLNKHYLI